ncbi:transporter [Zhengella mangrovi]|uniref:Transporter n=1 Tax=Zhengella mangrovi TaxID=1982044 RepID=A0A2G1QGQ8_9HYPH|nr:type IV secretory system conjugative DNA transfer family protein [Zhengella mangrovi]PHP64695.1 transporter [Zhengella mangrovi]
MGNDFDIFGDAKKTWGTISQGAKIGWKLGRSWGAERWRKQVEPELGSEVADAVAQAVKAGRNPAPIIERARKEKAEREERERLLASPPPLYGSARWAEPLDLQENLKGREAFDNPSSILLGAMEATEPSYPSPGFVHWDREGHLLTLAPSRQGKAVTVIVPNLLRYRGSAIVLDPKGELYEMTSKWRAENVGPVYRIAPFDNEDPTKAGWVSHGFNPLACVRSQAEARLLAELLFPRDPNASEFFSDDAATFLTGLMMFILKKAPPEKRNLATVIEYALHPLPKFKATLQYMASSGVPAAENAANAILGKNEERGLPTFRDTLNSKLGLWGDPDLMETLRKSDVDFASLKERPATVYVDIPFKLITPYSPWLRVLFKAALEEMTRSRDKPEIQTLFVLDEFLALGPFPEFRDAIRTHAGSGVRLWFFLQDMGTLEYTYPNGGWKPFLNCAVRQFFGTDDPDTGALIGKYLGTKTEAFRSTNSGTNISAQQGDMFGDGGGSGVNFSSGESIQFTGRPLLHPDEVMDLLSDWKGDGWRYGIVHMRGPRPIKVRLTTWDKSETCKSRIGTYIPSPAKTEKP